MQIARSKRDLFLFPADLPKGQSEPAGTTANQEQETESGRSDLSGLQRAGPGERRRVE